MRKERQKKAKRRFTCKKDTACCMVSRKSKGWFWRAKVRFCIFSKSNRFSTRCRSSSDPRCSIRTLSLREEEGRGKREEGKRRERVNRCKVADLSLSISTFLLSLFHSLSHTQTHTPHLQTSDRLSSSISNSDVAMILFKGVRNSCDTAA